MHVARGSHTHQQGGMQRLALPACTGMAILKGSRQWFVGFHSADGSPFLTGCTCPVDQINASRTGCNDLLTMERQGDMLGSLHQSESLLPNINLWQI